MKHHSFGEENGFTLRCNKGCSVYTETEHPLMTDYDSDIVGVERLHQQLRKLMSLIYDDIICYFMMNMNLLSSDLTAKITKYPFIR